MEPTLLNPEDDPQDAPPEGEDAPAVGQDAPAEAPTEGQAEGEEAPAEGQATKKVEGRDRETVELKRQYEAEVEHKVASDYSHIVWAYGIIWALFAIYGVILWRRSSAQKTDLEALRQRKG